MPKKYAAVRKDNSLAGTFPNVTRADEDRLRAAGFAPIVRWVDVANRSDTPLKLIEALTLLDRRDEAAMKQKRK